MSTINVKITDFVPEFMSLMQKGYGDRVFTNSLAAMRTIGRMYQKVWRQFASGEKVVPGSPPIFSKGPYTRSIQIDESTSNVISVYTDYYGHEYIEKGHPQIDLKPGLLSGPKARQGKKGPYNIVHFRHGVPGSDPHRNNPMPVSIYDEIRRLTKEADEKKQAGLDSKPGGSRVTGNIRVWEYGKDRRFRSYLWGQSISKTDTTGGKPKKPTGYQWKSGKYAGMYQMQTSTGRAKRSSYITFRVVSYRSDPTSWIVPARPAIPIRQATVDLVRPIAQNMIRQAIEKDIA